MAELILTDTELAAALWTDLDDASLGRLLRKKMAVFSTAVEQMSQALPTVAAISLCGEAVEAGAAQMVIELEDVTLQGRSVGSWVVTVARREGSAYGR